KGITPLDELKQECEKRSVPLFSTTAMSSTAITRTTYFLEETMAPKLTMHSGLLDVYGIGVLLLGDSGIGKSECALDLVHRRHRRRNIRAARRLETVRAAAGGLGTQSRAARRSGGAESSDEAAGLRLRA